MFSVARTPISSLFRVNLPRRSIIARIGSGSISGLGYLTASVIPVSSNFREAPKMSEASSSKNSQEASEPMENCDVAVEKSAPGSAEELSEKAHSSDSGKYSGSEGGLRTVNHAKLVDQFLRRYCLRGDCHLILTKGDITTWSIDGHSDAIVNAANEAMLGGSGVDGAIHRAAGRGLVEACRQEAQVGRGVRCPTGEARITGGFLLPAAHVIHTVGPVFSQYRHPAPVLASAYRSSLEVANANKLKYICFPALSCGIYGYPFDDGAFVALTTAHIYGGNLKEIHFVLFDEPIWDVWRLQADKLFKPLK